MSIDNQKNMDTSEASNHSMPSMIAQLQNNKMDTTQYKVRIRRFEIDAGTGDIAELEQLYTRGIDGSNDVVILKEKSFTTDDIMIVIVFYMEKKLGNDPASVLKTLSEIEED